MAEKKTKDDVWSKDEGGNISGSSRNEDSDGNKLGQEIAEQFVVQNGNLPARLTGERPVVRSAKYHDTLANTSFLAIEAIGTAVAVFEVIGGTGFSLVTANHAYGDIVGKPVNEICGLSVDAFLEPELAETLRRNLYKCVESRQAVSYKVELNIEDSLCWYKSTVTPQYDHEGNVKYIVLATTDITPENTEYLSAIRQHAELMNSFGEFSQMYSTAAHDLRSPICELDVILNLISMRVNEPSDELRQMFSMADTLVEKALQYLDDVLQNYQYTNVPPPEDQPVSLHELCDDIKAILDPRNTAKITHSDDLLSTDRITMQILLRNLIDNALKHNHDHRDLSVRITVQQQENEMLQVSVEDNGKGLDENEKVIRDHAKDSGGYGLPAARRLAVSRGGDLWVSECPIGAKICFFIPGKIINQCGHAA